VKLEELKSGMLVEGVSSDGAVTLKSVEPGGDGAVEVIFKDASGNIGERLLFRADEANLKVVREGGGWRFDGDGARFRLAAEARRIGSAYLFDPLLAVHASLVDPYPHQISAVYERMLNRQPLRFLLADDPGAGKTIMAGLLIKELIARGDLERCMIVCPGSLVEQWQDELRGKFMLPFSIVAREQIESSMTGDPFTEEPFVICRLDHLARNEEVRKTLEQTEWDLIVADEAHKMSASFSGGEVKPTKRYQLGELLSGITRHFLLMTATPHNGKEEDFQLFMRLLDADRFERYFRGGRAAKVDTSDVMRRMVKEDLKKFDGCDLFPPRVAHTVPFSLSGAEHRLYEDVTDYVRTQFNRAEQAADGRKRTVGFALTVLQRRLASSPEAIYLSLSRRRKRLEEKLKEARRLGRVARDSSLDTLVSRIEDYDDQLGSVREVQEFDDAGEVEETEEAVLDLATAATTIRELEAEIFTLKTLEEQARRLRTGNQDRKWAELRGLLQNRHLSIGREDGEVAPRKLIIFTEHRDTLDYLERKLTALQGEGWLVKITGGMNRQARKSAQERFLNDPATTLLLATDAAGEGVNLQRASLMVNYDLPWNPNRLEQRFGRIHRIGQTEECHVWNLVAGDTREGQVYRRLLEKLEVARKALGGKVFDVLGEMFREHSLSDLLIKAVRESNRGTVSRNVTSALDLAMERERLRRIIEDQALTHEAMDPEVLGSMREEMERAAARRLQPHFVASFFLEAVRLFGGKPTEPEKGRYRLGKVPDRIFERARRLPGGASLANVYERITFEKPLRSVKGKLPATFFYPGHPVVDAAGQLVLERCSENLARGAALVDESDPGDELRVLALLEHTVRDGRKGKDGENRIAGRKMQFVEVSVDGTTRDAGFAPHLDYRPLREDERRVLRRAADLPGDAAEKARGYAAGVLAREHLRELRERREAQVEKVRGLVRERLTAEIGYWDRRLGELWDEVGRRPDVRVTINDFTRRRDDLSRRLERRMEELDRQLDLIPAPPNIIGAALVIPAGMLTEVGEPTASPVSTFAASPEARKRVGDLAMQAVIIAERSLGHDPKDVSKENRGYDIESKDKDTERLRMIEVKGRVKGAETVTVTRNEILAALNKPEDFILALVEVDGDYAAYPRYVRRPFDKEPGFTEVSVNHDLKKLLALSESPS
jgi:superfamily II DNA or RNA helicase